MSTGDWLSIGQVAKHLGVHRNTALAHVRDGRIPGGEMLYKLDDGRERWRVRRSTFTTWRAANAAKRSNSANAAD